jgi:ion channel-forming bestrophin family protein
MQAGGGFKVYENLLWLRKYILLFLLIDSIPVILYISYDVSWLIIPWQPISLIGIITAFFLAFKNNSAYERLWEGRKIWGGIVNVSRSFTVHTRDYVSNEFTSNPVSEEELKQTRKTIVHRHVAWLKAMTYQLRESRTWENNTKDDKRYRKQFDTEYSLARFEELREYLSPEEYQYVMKKGNQASQILSLQSRHLATLKQQGYLDDFRHTGLAPLLTEMYALQGKSERLKNFPLPTGYTSLTSYFTWVFVLLLPFGMLNAFEGMSNTISLWAVIPFSMLVSWVFFNAKQIGQYTENPFEGLNSDIPIFSLARSIEIDIRQMLDESNLPEPLKPEGNWHVLH